MSPNHIAGRPKGVRAQRVSPAGRFEASGASAPSAQPEQSAQPKRWRPAPPLGAHAPFLPPPEGRRGAKGAAVRCVWGVSGQAGRPNGASPVGAFMCQLRSGLQVCPRGGGAGDRQSFEAR